MGRAGWAASMYTLDATTGVVAEVTGSPFAGSTDTRLGSVAAESTGQYVYVLKFNLNDIYPANSTVILDTLQVDAANEQLVPQPSQTIQLPGTIVAEAVSPHGFYLLLNQSGGSYPAAMLYAILFDATSGAASPPQLLEPMSDNARAMLMDGFGKNLVVSAGQDSGSLWFVQLSETDGTVSAVNSVALAFEEFATLVAFDPTSSFFYLELEGTGASESGVRIFSVATQTETASSPVPASLTSELAGLPDPQGPFSFFGPMSGGGIAVFGVDPSTGYPLVATGFTNPLFPGRDLGPGLATVDLNSQPEQAPAASLSGTSLSLGSVNVGQTSSSQSVTLTNTGTLALSFTSIQLTGANAGDFTESDTCMSSPQLQPTILHDFGHLHPSVAGSGSAPVLVTDNASGSPQQIALSGTGVSQPPPSPPPAVTLNPNPLNFPGTVTEGTLSTPQNLVLTNSGNATLHVQTIVLGGPNSSDFTISANNCIGAIAANTNCQVSLTFAPLGPGVRSATLTITDDAANSPQTLSITGSGGAAAQITGASGSTTATQCRSAGTVQSAGDAGRGIQRLIDLHVRRSADGRELQCALECNRFERGCGKLHGDGDNFGIRRNGPMETAEALRASSSAAVGRRRSMLLAWLLLLWQFGTMRFQHKAWAMSAAACLLLCSVIGIAGCAGGGGSAAPAPTVVVTPSGTYTITVTPTATSSATSKQFPLSAVSLTLIVK